MAKSLESLSNNALANEIDRRNASRDSAIQPIWNSAARHDERWLQIVERLGASHPLVIAYRKSNESIEEVYQEARRRCGPPSYDSLYPMLLRGMGRRRAA